MRQRIKKAIEASRLKRFVEHLTSARFDKIYHGRQLDFFHEFLRTQATRAGGFVLTSQLEEGGIVWILYRIKNVTEGEKQHNFDLYGPEIAVPNEDCPGNRECPEEWKVYPVYRLPT